MHSNPAFRQTGVDQNLAFARARGFGILALNGEAGPLLSHIPFLISGDGGSVDLHLARPNPIARATLPACATLIVPGPDGYISPDWYGAEDQVPTWNYVAVHLRGMLEPLPVENLRDHLDALTARFEGDLLPKTPWLSSKMTDGVMDRMMRMILPFRLYLTGVEGTWKLGQNKPDEVRLAAADAVERSTSEAPSLTLARLMKQAGA